MNITRLFPVGVLVVFAAAIELAAQTNSDSMTQSGWGKNCVGDFAGVIADFDRAIELNPTDAHIVSYRALAKQANGNLDDAIADFDKAIKMDPKDAEAYRQRGNVKREKGDLDGAIADYDRSIAIDPESGIASYAYDARGCARYLKGMWTDALADFRKGNKLCGFWGESSIIWVIRTRLGEREAATRELEQYLSSKKDSRPVFGTTTIGRFLTGDLSEDDFIRIGTGGTSRNEKSALAAKSQTYFYAGSKRLLDGDKAAAADYFKKCLEWGGKKSFFCQSAAAELKALQK